MYVFQGTRKDLFSHSSTFSFFSTEFCQQKKQNPHHIWHSRHHLYQSFLLNMLKKITKAFNQKPLTPVWCGPSKPCLFHLLHPVFFLSCESSDTRGSLLHTWSIENSQRCEVSTPNAPSESEKTLQRDFPDRVVPIDSLNAQLWYLCVRFCLKDSWLS